jgi:hypothetical protein
LGTNVLASFKLTSFGSLPPEDYMCKLWVPTRERRPLVVEDLGWNPSSTMLQLHDPGR